MTQLIPYLRFNDKKCREAMTYYKEIFGGEVTFQTLGESPMKDDMPEKSDYIMHSTFKKDSFEFFASDMMRDKATVGDNIALSLTCKTETELRSLFDKLAKEGEVFMPVENTFWGIFGVVTDKYGIEWMLNLNAPPTPKP